MVRVIDTPVKVRVVDAPGKEPSIRKPGKMMTTCPACDEFFKSTQDEKLLGKNAEFTNGYAVRDADNLPYRIYYCHMCDSVSACRVHFKRCTYKNEIIEYDTDMGKTHYVTCREPYFKCDKCRTDVPMNQWFCEILDRSPIIRFMDVYNDPWFTRMKRELLDEAIIIDREAMYKWVTERKIRRR